MKKRILLTAKQDGVLSFFFPMLGALGSWIGKVASVVKAVNDSKVARRQFEELQRYDRAMEQSRGLYLPSHKYERGLYLSPYKCRQGVATKKKCQRDYKNDLGYNYQHAIGRAHEMYARTLEVFSCVTLYRRVARVESDIVNLDDAIQIVIG